MDIISRRVIPAGLGVWIAWSAIASANADPSVQAQRVAVVPVAVLNLEPGEADAVLERMREALAHALIVEVASGDRVRALGDRVSEDCAGEPRCVGDIGQALEVSEILFVALVRIGGRLQVNVTWVDVAVGSPEMRDPVRIEGGESESDVFTREAARLLPRAERRPAPAPPEPEPIEDTPSVAIPIVTEPNEDRLGRHATTGTWIAGGVSVVALVGGSVLGLRALGIRNDLREIRDGGDCSGGTPCPVPANRLSDLEQARNLSDGMFALAALAGVTAGVLYWRSGGDGTVVQVSAVPSHVGVALTSLF